MCWSKILESNGGSRMKMKFIFLFLCLFSVGYTQGLSGFAEDGVLGLGFGILLIFVLQQYRRLLEELMFLQREVVGVVEKNTLAHIELRQAFDRLSACVA